MNRMKQNIIEYSILAIFAVLLFLGANWISKQHGSDIYTEKLDEIILKLDSLNAQTSEKQKCLQQSKEDN
jgi:hypothetical protein